MPACAPASTTSSSATACRATRSGWGKGCVVFSSEPLYEYRDYATKVDEELSTLSWLYHMNHGIFMTPGVDEQWTLSVAHSDDELQRYIDAYEAFARDVTACNHRVLRARHDLRWSRRLARRPGRAGEGCCSPGDALRRRVITEPKREALAKRTSAGAPSGRPPRPTTPTSTPTAPGERERRRRGLR